MRALNFSVELGAARFDVSVSDALVLDMPVELSLKLVAIVGAYLLNAERKLFDDVVSEVYGVRLCVTLVDFQCSHTGCIINRGILVAFDLSAAFSSKYQELHVHLDMVTRYLFVVALCMHLPHARAAREAVQLLALEDAIDASI